MGYFVSLRREQFQCVLGRLLCCRWGCTVIVSLRREQFQHVLGCVMCCRWDCVLIFTVYPFLLVTKFSYLRKATFSHHRKVASVGSLKNGRTQNPQNFQSEKTFGDLEKQKSNSFFLFLRGRLKVKMQDIQHIQFSERNN